MPFSEMRALAMFSFLSDVETLYGSMVPHYPGVNETFAAALLILLQNQGAFCGVCCHSVCICEWLARMMSSHCGQYSCSPLRYPCTGQMLNTGVTVI